MRRLGSLLALCLCVAPPCGAQVRSAEAQEPKRPAAQPAAKPPATPAAKPAARAAKPAAKPATKPAAKPTARETKLRREDAIALVVSLAEEARQYHDPTLRARVQARSADALWDYDRPRAVALFRRSWEAAELSEREARARRDEALKARERRGARVDFGYLDVRTEVLRLAAARDRALGEEFLAKLNADAQAPDTGPVRGPEATRELTDPPDQVRRRLGLAQTLLENKDVEQAKRFAEPALHAVSIAAVRFLAALRAADPESADELYVAMAAGAAADPRSDANTVSVLASYVFSPSVFVVLGKDGGYNTRQFGPRTAPQLPEAVRDTFFQAAAQVLLRELTPAQYAATSAGYRGTAFMIARLLPLFEQHASPLAGQLRNRLQTLDQEHPEAARRDDQMLRQGLSSDPSQEEGSLADLIDRAREAPAGPARDQAFVTAVMAAVRVDDPRLRELVDSIEDLDLRRRVRGFADFRVLLRRVEKEPTADETLRLARSGDLTPIQRVWGLSRIARQVAKNDKTLAAEILNELAEVSRRIGADDPDRVRGLLAAATGFVDVDPARAPELVNEAAKAAARAPDFTGEDGSVRSTLETEGMAMAWSEDAPEFDLQEVFAALARTDMEGATLLAKSFAGEAPRAAAVLAVAQAVLAEKDRPARPAR